MEAKHGHSRINKKAPQHALNEKFAVISGPSQEGLRLVDFDRQDTLQERMTKCSGVSQKPNGCNSTKFLESIVTQFPHRPYKRHKCDVFKQTSH